MNFGAFAGGLSKGLDKSMDPLGLKGMMMGDGGQGQGQPQQLVGLPEQLSGPPPEQGGQAGAFGGLKDLMMRLFGSMGG